MLLDARQTISRPEPAEPAGRVHRSHGPDAASPGFTAPVDQLFAAQVARRPDAIAVVADGLAWDYATLDRHANRLARRLSALGVVPGALVGTFLPRSAESVAAFLAILKLGAAFVPFDPSYPAPARLAAVLDSRPVVMVAAHALAAGAAFWTCATLWIDSPADLAGPEPDAPLPPAGHDGEALASVMYTSGSTGTPKGVMVPHRGIARLVIGADYVSLSADETMLQLAPLAFDASTLEIWGALLNGGRLAILPDAVPSLDGIADAIRQFGVTTLWLTAGLFHMMVEHRLDGLRPLRQLLAGGDVLSASAVRRVQQALPGCQVINGYGPTENTTFTCCYRVPAGFAGDTLPIGLPISGTRIAVLDDAMRPVPPGEVGQLCAGGAGVALGYLNDPVRTAEKFIADPAGGLLYLTGDLVRQRPDGVVEFLGRADRQVKINGKRVELDEIESAMRLCPLVAEAGVLFTAPENGPKRVLCFVQPAGEQKDIEAGLRAHARAMLADHMVPSRFIVLDRFPMTPSGKIDRRALVAPPEAAPPGATTAGPDSPEETIRQVWRQALGRDAVGLDDNFFDLGGTSLQLIGVHAQLQAAAFPGLKVLDLFAHPTIRQLAARLARPEPAATLDAARSRAQKQGEAMRRMQMLNAGRKR